METPAKTEFWFDDLSLEKVYDRYGSRFLPSQLSYATVEDFCDSFDNLRPLATANSDLKDVQRPWIFKAVLGLVPRGACILEIGAGEPWVADLLSRLGYKVWVVDPYDGSGNGPGDHDAFASQCPRIRFIRDHFSNRLPHLAPLSFDCVYSISVLEHLHSGALHSVAAGLSKFLKPGGVNLHAVDHVHRGNGSDGHLVNLRLMANLFGFADQELEACLAKVDRDPETYFLSAESHNRWRGALPYRDFPMRVCISIQLLGRGSDVQI